MSRFTNCRANASDRPTILCPCPAPKRLITSSNWISRNDSSSINAILHPENYLFSPRLKYDDKTKGDVIAKQILSRNNCYCRCKGKKLPRPTFFKRPNSCVSNDIFLKISSAAEYEDDLKRKSLTGCVCNNIDDEVSDPENLRSRATRPRKTKSLPVDAGLKYSDQRKNCEEYRQIQEERFQEKLQDYEDRKNYEEYRQIQEEKFQEKLQDYEDGERWQRLGEQLGAGDSEKVDTILSTQRFDTGTSISNYGRDPNQEYISDDLPTDEFPVYSEWSVPDFRREHYFETHDIGKVGEITGDVSKDHHTCIHQFKLSSRWLPEPLNKDAFGRSVCKVCEKPMDGSNIHLSSGYLSNGDRLSRSKIKNYAEAYKYGFSPTTINLGRGKSNIELVLNDNDFTKFTNYVQKCKKLTYCNSLALRHQKLRVI